MQLVHLCLSNFRPGVDESANEADDDCGDGSEGYGGSEEYQTKDGDGKFVDGADH